MVTHPDRKTFKNEDLVLRVSSNVNPKIWDDSRYEGFLTELCDTREFQAEAIRTVLRFLLGRKYPSLRELARENFEGSLELQQLHGAFAHMEQVLQFPDKASCSVDLATGTGKSYVLYALAAILLAEGVVDRVLLLCPSTTIEDGLLKKFRLLAGSRELQDALPRDAVVRVPRIINASETITEGSICVENYHAVLEHVKSSIRDSLRGRGAKTLVLCDEAHHVANQPAGSTKEWKRFLDDPEFGFRMVVGCSGTCYVGDSYFSDVVYRYSIREAIEDRRVKRPEYVAEMPVTNTADEKWQLVHNRHREWKKRLAKRDLKPLTIVVTKGIAECKRVAAEIREFLQDRDHLSKEEVAARVLEVTSAAEHQPNLARLATVDENANPVEWIVSVSMLSEGWDVRNVFQIVPHEERAFNSKLLISQVLGRGLRVPEGWQGEPPIVTVFNHDAWSGRIRHLVNEVLEVERRLTSRVLPDSPHHFALSNLDYSRHEDVTESTKKGEYRLLESGYVSLPTQVEREDVTIGFERALSGERSAFRTEILRRTYSADYVAEEMFQRLRSIDEESAAEEDPAQRTRYSKRFTFEKCLEIVQASLERAGISSGVVTDDNRQRFLAALGTLRRGKSKKVVYRPAPRALFDVSTRTRQVESCSAAELRRRAKSIAYSPDCNVDPEEAEFFREVKDPDGDFASSTIEISSAADFRTPANFVIADSENERRFVRELCKRENCKHVDAWLKNAPQRFYWIEYAWKKGTYPKRGEFSPDFFVRVGTAIHVVEIKGDEETREPSPENTKKHEYAVRHFRTLNRWLEKDGRETRYFFNFLTPSDYGVFFQMLRDGKLKTFRSSLDVSLDDADEG